MDPIAPTPTYMALWRGNPIFEMPLKVLTVDKTPTVSDEGLLAQLLVKSYKLFNNISN